VAQAFLLVVSQSGEGLVFAEHLEPGRIGAVEEAVVEAADDLAEFSAVRCDADAVAVAFLAAERDVPADAGNADDGVHKTEDLLDVLDWHDLAEMDLLHLSADEPCDDTPYEARGLLEFFKTLQTFFERFGVCEEVLNELSPANVAQQVIGVIFRLQIPLFALAVL